METKVAAAADVEDGAMKCFDVAGKEILVIRAQGRLFAIDALCSHGLAYLEEGSLEGCNIVCPLHGGCFDIRTGAATKHPAVKPIAVYPVREDGEAIFIEVQ